MKKNEVIAVVDFGSQYAHLIANRIRRLHVYAEIVLPETPLEDFKKYKAIILSGGPQSVYEKNAPTIDPGIFTLGVPILGICYGSQLVAYLMGGKVEPGKSKEYGMASLNIEKSVGIFKGVSKKSQVWMSHGDTVTQLPKDFEMIAQTSDCPYAAFADLKRKIYTTQFHLEVKHTHEGMKILDAFLKLTGVKREWGMKQFLSQKMAEIKEKVGDRNVFLLASGGVDSTVAYVMLAKALGAARVYGLFVDTGLLRKNEAKKTATLLRKVGIKNFHVYNGQKEFLSALKGVVDPEEKRAIIGTTFLKVQAKAVKQMKLDPEKWVLGQGTIYPDTIESKGTKHADKIKTHHNRVPEIMQMIEENKVIEPLAELYKDEVRELGTQLGLPNEMVWKHPFPGPGLAVRMLCSNGKADLPDKHAEHERLIAEYLKKEGLENGCIAPIRSVGVGGDNRSYKHPLFIWNKKNKAVSFAKLEHISTYVTNHFPIVNRVCLLLAPEKITKIKAFKADLSPKRIALTQKLDDIVMGFVVKNKIMRDVWQFPTVLVPLHINNVKKDAVILRPICSDEAMTAHFYKMNQKLLAKLVKLLKPHVSAVLFDVTNKPPGTIEWE
ncbi:glutamine-hydrolyzing GMP synthase [Candidatus Gracilibacteria bacterium]|nr:glutamine-hydrolyzing GMP synthase [Candidatus Gracilibacteria bacterium]